MNTVEQPVRDTEIACNLDVFDAEQRARHSSNAETLLTGARAVVETAAGYAFRLPADAATLQQAAAFVAAERRCCPFFRFDLTVRGGEDAAWLELGGSAEVKAYMRQELLVRLRGARPDLVPGAMVEPDIGGDGAGCRDAPG